MNNYTHSYSQYVDHILNRSPSKTSYTFSKAQRFPKKQQQNLLTDISHSKYHHEPLYYQPRTSYRKNSPDRKPQTPTNSIKKDRQYFQEKEVKRDINNIINSQYKQLSRSHSKSPIARSSKPDKSAKKDQKQQKSIKRQSSFIKQKVAQINMPSPSKNNKSLSSLSKKDGRSMKKLNTHRVQTEANYLIQIDHVSKNRTSRGYYPTGIQISPNGKYPISTIKNRPNYSFGKPILQSRYLYIKKHSNDIGPGYYDHYSEFGQFKRK